MNILFLTHRLPYAPNRGDRVRAYHILRELAEWANVDVLSLAHDAEEASHAPELSGIAASVATIRVTRLWNAVRAVASLPTQKPTTHSMLDGRGLIDAARRLAAARKPAVVLSYCSGIAPLALEQPLRDVPLVLDMVDVDSAKWAELAKTSSPPLSWIYARESGRLSQFEREVSMRARATLVVTEKERKTLAAIAPGARIEVIPNGVDAGHLRRADTAVASDLTVVFCGVMNYAPNVEGVRWFIRNVWPIVRNEVSNARFEIVGSRPTRAVQALADPRAGITVTGEVADVRPHLWGAAVSVAPLLTARGVQNKVLEAIAAGLPVVVTPVVSEGLPSEAGTACSVAADAPSFAAAIVNLLRQSPEDRRAIAASVDIDSLSWKRRLEPLRQLLTEAALP